MVITSPFHQFRSAITAHCTSSQPCTDLGATWPLHQLSRLADPSLLLMSANDNVVFCATGCTYRSFRTFQCAARDLPDGQRPQVWRFPVGSRPAQSR